MCWLLKRPSRTTLQISFITFQQFLSFFRFFLLFLFTSCAFQPCTFRRVHYSVVKICVYFKRFPLFIAINKLLILLRLYLCSLYYIKYKWLYVDLFLHLSSNILTILLLMLQTALFVGCETGYVISKSIVTQGTILP